MELLDKHFWLSVGCVGLNCCGEAAAILGESPVCCKVTLVLFSFFFPLLNLDVLFLFCDSRVSPVKQMLKALNGRVVALERLSDP